MPILNGSATFARYSAELIDEPPADLRRWLSRILRQHAFRPIDKAGEEERSSGFVEIENHDAAEFAPGTLFNGDHALMAWRVDTLKVKMADVKAELAQWAVAFEAEQQRVPTNSEKAARRTALRQAMRASTEPTSKVYDLSWNLKDQKLLIWTASRGAVDQIVGAMESSFRLRLHAPSPSAVARREEIADELLGPTPELVGIELSGKDAARLAWEMATDGADGDGAGVKAAAQSETKGAAARTKTRMGGQRVQA